MKLIKQKEHDVDTVYIDEFSRANRNEAEWWKLAGLCKKLDVRMVGQTACWVGGALPPAPPNSQNACYWRNKVCRRKVLSSRHADWAAFLLRLSIRFQTCSRRSGWKSILLTRKPGSLQSVNLPKKSNFKRHTGLDAKTGKSNFDISEWMLIHLIESLREKNAVLAMLCKTAVARKVLEHAWRKGIRLGDAELRHIDSVKNFGAAADAGALICTVNGSQQSTRCATYTQFSDENSGTAMAFRDGKLIADVSAYESLQHLQGEGPYRWRSGINHDCSKVMELYREGNRFRNGHGELMELEETYVYPMLKGSEVAKGATTSPSRWMLVPQRRVGEETATIETRAPKTWDYLMAHAHLLDKRGSSIYKSQPRFAIFGIGDYSFADHKVAVAGFYKKFAFTNIGCFRDKPIVLDDTVYFLTCQSEEEADCVSFILNSELAKEFYSAFVFWDCKRLFA